VLQYPDKAEQLGAGIADLFRNDRIDVVVGPAMGGVIIAQEVGRALRKRAIFTERENGVMTLRRGFELKPGERVLVVEDVITTGGSAGEVAERLAAQGAVIAGVSSIIDRSNGTASFAAPFRPLAAVTVETYKPEACPLCKQGSTAVKPGSRGLK
jgi:orotate phosphoribosyltransferase